MSDDDRAGRPAVTFTVVSVPMPALDTGLGREAGYANDDELREAAAAQRAALPPAVRAIADEFDAELDRRILGL